MTRISLCLLLVVVSAAAKSESSLASGFAEEVPSDPNGKVKQDGDECDASSVNQIVCENDRLKFCGPNNVIMSTPCLVNGRQGFCNCEKTACVPERPTCGDEKINCYQPNTKLPDNLDCHKFSYCNQNNEKITLKCPGNLIYEPKEEKCLDQSSARCSRLVCPRPGNALQLIPFPQANNYYVLCYKGVGDVRKCSDSFYGVRNNTCQFDCKLKNVSGVFKDTNLQRCRKGIFYACRKAGTNVRTFEGKCSTGLTFDENLGLCTAEDTCA